MSLDAGLIADAADYAALIQARHALAADLMHDPATMARGLDDQYVMRAHLRRIGNAMRDVLDGVDDRLLILTPPQVGKSTTVAEWGPFWWLANRPKDDIVIVSYGLDLALERSKAVQEKIGEYGPDYDLQLLRGSSTDRNWRTTTGGHLRAVGVGGGLSGFRANLLIIDDPHKDRAQAESKVTREAVHDWYSSTGVSRLQPDKGAVVAIQTRWHEDDFAGRRLKDEGDKRDGGRWRVLHFPAIADPDLTGGPDLLGRAPGAPLTHPKVHISDSAKLVAWWKDRKLESTNRDWHALYQGDPKPPSGALVTKDLFRTIRLMGNDVQTSPPRRSAVAIDPSGGGRSQAGVIGGYEGEDGRLWITHDRSGHMPSDQWSVAACLLAYEIGATVIVVETNFGADMATLIVRTAWDKLQRDGVEVDGQLRRIPVDDNPCPLIRTVRGVQNKLLRAEPIAQQMLMDRVRLAGYFAEMEREWETWQPTDKHSPGRIDASVYLALYLLNLPSSGASFGLPTGPMPASSTGPLGGSFGGASSFGPLGGG